MVACKVILAVAVVFVAAVVQIHGRPADTDWGIPFEEELKNMTKNIASFVNVDNSEIATAAKNNLNSFVEGFKSELAVFTKSFEGKAGVSDLFKESTKQFQTTIDNYVKNLPKEVNLKEFNEKAEQALKHMVEYGTEITKKAQGNTEIEKQVKDFIKKNIDFLFEQTKAVQAKIADAKKA